MVASQPLRILSRLQQTYHNDSNVGVDEATVSSNSLIVPGITDKHVVAVTIIMLVCKQQPDIAVTL